MMHTRLAIDSLGEIDFVNMFTACKSPNLHKLINQLLFLDPTEFSIVYYTNATGKKIDPAMFNRSDTIGKRVEALFYEEIRAATVKLDLRDAHKILGQGSGKSFAKLLGKPMVKYNILNA